MADDKTWGRFQLGNVWLCLRKHGNGCDDCDTVEICPGCMIVPRLTQCPACGTDQRRRLWCRECAGGDR